MKNGFRQSMAWLHTWSGLIVGWVLFAVFVTGTASYYRSDITRWMRPEIVRASEPSPEALAKAAEHGVAYLQTHAGQARNWFIGLPTAERPLLDLFWRTRPGTEPGHAELDPETGAPTEVRATLGGDFLYRFHFELHMAPLWGRWVVGICAMIMLVALLSGIVTHRRIFADFFTFRRAKSAQRGWLDAHNVSGVLALPFHLMITYTGLVTLATLYMPWGVDAAYKGDRQTFFAETGQVTTPRPPSGQPGTLAPVGPMVLQAKAAIDGQLGRVSIQNPRDANSTVIAVFEEPHGLSHEHPQMAFAGTTGAVVQTLGGGLRSSAQTMATMVGLHEAHFAGPALRFLFFLCGIAGCAMVATGLLLWSVARLPKPNEASGFGLRLVQGLNLGAVAGLPAGIAAYFLANRLLPIGLAERSEWEVRVFFGVWLLFALVAPFRPLRRGWSEFLGAAAALYALVGALDAIRLASSPARPIEALYPVFDATMLGLAALLAFAAYKTAAFEDRRAKRDAERLRPVERTAFAALEAGE